MSNEKKPTIRQRLIELLNQSPRLDYDQIAKIMNDEGYKTPSKGLDWSMKVVSKHAIKYGLQRRNKNKAKAPPPAKAKEDQRIEQILEVLTSSLSEKVQLAAIKAIIQTEAAG